MVETFCETSVREAGMGSPEGGEEVGRLSGIRSLSIGAAAEEVEEGAGCAGGACL